MSKSSRELSRRGDEIFDRYNCYPGEGERNHCLRLVEFALLHGRRAGIDVDDDLLHLAAMLHDLGLMVPIRPETNYLTRTVELAREELDDLDLGEPRWATLEECLLYNHALRPPHRLEPLAEAFRRAVFTEHSRGVRRFGLPRGDVKAVFRELRWDNFSAVLADFVWKTGVFEAGTIPQIFFPSRPQG